MPSTIHVSTAWITMTALATIIVIALPFVLGGIAHKKLAVGWKYFWFGALVFLVFQIATRVPLVFVLENTVLAPLLRTSAAFTWTWLVILALSAALFEEVGRYVGYLLFMRREPKTWSKGVMFGLGHEGLESLILVGATHILTLINIVALLVVPFTSLPVAQRQTILQQVTAINAQPIWLPLLAAWERLWSFPLQVALSVMVLQVFRQRRIYWLFLAILFHTLIDFLSLALPQAFGQTPSIELLIEGIICLFGIFGIWIIWRLREPDDAAQMGETVAPGAIPPVYP